jgi:hypothetical protein
VLKRRFARSSSEAKASGISTEGIRLENVPEGFGAVATTGLDVSADGVDSDIDVDGGKDDADVDGMEPDVEVYEDEGEGCCVKEGLRTFLLFPA